VARHRRHDPLQHRRVRKCGRLQEALLGACAVRLRAGGVADWLHHDGMRTADTSGGEGCGGQDRGQPAWVRESGQQQIRLPSQPLHPAVTVPDKEADVAVPDAGVAVVTVQKAEVLWPGEAVRWGPQPREAPACVRQSARAGGVARPAERRGGRGRREETARAQGSDGAAATLRSDGTHQHMDVGGREGPDPARAHGAPAAPGEGVAGTHAGRATHHRASQPAPTTRPPGSLPRPRSPPTATPVLPGTTVSRVRRPGREATIPGLPVSWTGLPP
ncbi:hypothetical protein BaRGS_00006776, partial [Batillaria attramentaria]